MSFKELGDHEFGHINDVKGIYINNPLNLLIIQLIKRTHGSNTCIQSQKADIVLSQVLSDLFFVFFD